MPEFYMILARKKMIKIPEFLYFSKNSQNSRSLDDFCPKNARISHNNCPKNIFPNFRGHVPHPSPPSPMPMNKIYYAYIND